MLATDALIDEGGELASLSSDALGKLNALLPPQWSHANPIDVLGDAGPERYAKSLEIAAADETSDGLLVILTPQDMTDPTRTAEAVRPYAKLPGKPVLASWMGGLAVRAGEEVLNGAGIPTFPFPDTAARAFHYMWRYTYNLRGLYETPALPRGDGGDAALAAAAAGHLIAEVSAAGRTLLDEVESKRVLSAHGIPTTCTEAAGDEEAAVRLADAAGYPVVVKLLSRTLTHKTEVGGVRLNLADAAAVRRAFADIRSCVLDKAGESHFQGVSVQPMARLTDAYEIILGSSIDAQFGPVLLFGAGGQLVEIFKDRALALPPLNATLARRMMEQTKIHKALQGVRGRAAVDLAALEQLLVNFSRLVIEQPRIKEIDINPLLVSCERIVALDARVVLFPGDIPDGGLPRPAIRPYPLQHVERWVMKDGTPVLVRPIRPEDEPLLVKFHGTLSDASVRLRYFHPIKLSQRVSHERLSRICFNDYDRELALVAERRDPSTGECSILGIARLSKLPGTSEAEFGILISNVWQRRGLGAHLLGRLLQVARDEHVSKLSADILGDNVEMQQLTQKLGFHVERRLDCNAARAELKL